METPINCKTNLYTDREAPFVEATRRNVITDGLSEEALYYVNQACVRTNENMYNIFDNYGLMPDNYAHFNNLLKCRKLPICDYGENNEIYTVAERIKIEDIENGKIVHYDSDGMYGFDRIATYQNTPIGCIKTKEIFNADGDAINEVEIEREVETTTFPKYRGELIDNEEYCWYDNLLNLIGLGRNKQTFVQWYEYIPILNSSTVTIGVNADDLGYDDYGGNHFEYQEKVKAFAEGRSRKEYQFYTEWRYADKDDCEKDFK